MVFNVGDRVEAMVTTGGGGGPFAQPVVQNWFQGCVVSISYPAFGPEVYTVRDSNGAIGQFQASNLRYRTPALFGVDSHVVYQVASPFGPTPSWFTGIVTHVNQPEFGHYQYTVRSEKGDIRTLLQPVLGLRTAPVPAAVPPRGPVAAPRPPFPAAVPPQAPGCALCSAPGHRSTECYQAKTVYFIRNAASDETDPTKPNSELTAKGRQQANDLRSFVASQNLGIQMVISSPLIRAIHTAQLAFNGMIIPHRIDPYWRECGTTATHPCNRAVPGRKIEPSLASTFGPHRDCPVFDTNQVRELDNREHPLWQPEQESADPAGWAATIRKGAPERALFTLMRQLADRRIAAVVTHQNVLREIFGRDVGHCEHIRVLIRPPQPGGERGRWVITRYNFVRQNWEEDGRAQDF